MGAFNTTIQAYQLVAERPFGTLTLKVFRKKDGALVRPLAGRVVQTDPSSN